MLKELFLARCYLLRGKSRHISFIGLISCFGVAVGVAALITVISVMNGFDKDLTDRLLKFNHHIVIETIVPKDLDAVQEKVTQWVGVANVSKVLQTQVFGKFHDKVYPLVVKGIKFNDGFEWDNLASHISHDNGKPGIFIGQGVSDRFLVGEKLECYPLDKKLRVKELPVRGIFKVGLLDIDNNYIIGDFETIKLLSPNYILFLGVNLDNPANADGVKKRIKDEFGDTVFVTTWMESNSVLFSALQLEKYVMFVILSLIIFVACFNIFATLTVKVVEKTRDIGVLKTLGFTSRQVMVIFVIQGVLISVIGVLLGTGMGVGLCMLLKNGQFIQLPREIYYIDYLPVYFQWFDIFVIDSVAVIIAFFFSLMPAIRAAKLSACEALRYE